MLGDHCYRCGQPVKGLVRHFGSIIGDFLDSVFDFDSRTLRTLGPLLYRPGHLSNEYFAGRRVRYVSPLRLFVFLCIVSFFVLKIWVDPDLDGSVQVGDGEFASVTSIAEVEARRDAALQRMQATLEGLDSGSARAGLETGMAAVRASAQARIDQLAAAPAGAPSPKPPFKFRFDAGEWHPETNPVVFDFLPDAANAWINRMIGRAEDNMQKVQEQPRLLVETFLQTLPQTFFVLLPLFALLLKLVFFFKRRLYMEHLIVALHSHAFLCVCLLLLVGLDSLRGVLEPGIVQAMLTGAERVLLVWMPIYLFLTQKRVYGQGWFSATISFAFIGAAYGLLIVVGALLNLAFNLVAM